MDTNLSKAIMTRSRLRNKFLKFTTPESRDAYKGIVVYLPLEKLRKHFMST